MDRWFLNLLKKNKIYNSAVKDPRILKKKILLMHTLKSKFIKKNQSVYIIVGMKRKRFWPSTMYRLILNFLIFFFILLCAGSEYKYILCLTLAIILSYQNVKFSSVASISADDISLLWFLFHSFFLQDWYLNKIRIHQMITQIPGGYRSCYI